MLTAMLLLVASPAAAAPGDMEYSTDGGATWSLTPPPTLFPASFRAVPGDTLTATLFVRMLRSAPTVAMAVVSNAFVNDPMYNSALTISGDDGTGAGLTSTALMSVADCAPVVPTTVLTTGEVMQITFVVDVSPTLVAQQAQQAVAAFDLELGFTDVGAPTAPNGCPIDPTVIDGFPIGSTITGNIAYTGTDVLPAVAIAAAAWGVGLWLVIASRRRKQRR